MFFEHFSSHAETFKALRDAAINSDNVNDRTDFFHGYTVADCPTAMDFPFVHLAQGANHRQIHHGSGFRINQIVTPAETPAPGSHCLLKRPGKLIGCIEVFLNIICTKRYLALHKTLFEQVIVYVVQLPLWAWLASVHPDFDLFRPGINCLFPNSTGTRVLSIKKGGKPVALPMLKKTQVAEKVMNEVVKLAGKKKSAKS